MGQWCYRAALGFALLFSVGHLIALPLSISYDSFLYLDMADVLFSPRFPADWHLARTPLYPLALKLSFWLLGRQALAAIAVSTVMGVGALLVCGAAMRRVAGEIPAAIGLVGVCLLPTLVTYQHFMLTETGTLFFLALIVALLLWRPQTFAGLWAKTGLLIAVVTAGFYWRQTILPLAGVAALLHGAAAWKLLRGASGQWSLQRLSAVAVQLLLIAVLPFVLAKPWSRYTDEEFLRRLMINQGIMSQTLLPPDHPYLGARAPLYREAIAAGEAYGNFYSGIVGLPQFGELVNTVPNAWRERYLRFYFELIRENPRRYAAAVWRMTMLTAGRKARLNEMETASYAILCPEWHLESNTISEGPAKMQALVEKQFSQRVTPSFLMRRLWKIRKSYQDLVVFAMAVAAVGAIAGLVLRNLPLLTLYGVPLAFQVPYVLVLTTVDRYAFPTQVLVLAALPAFPVLVWKAIAARRGKPTASAPTAHSPSAVETTR
jgi:hypothetical protein